MLDVAEKLCRRKNWDNVTLIQGDAAELNIGENSFDAVISFKYLFYRQSH